MPCSERPQGMGHGDSPEHAREDRDHLGWDRGLREHPAASRAELGAVRPPRLGQVPSAPLVPAPFSEHPTRVPGSQPALCALGTGFGGGEALCVQPLR